MSSRSAASKTLFKSAYIKGCLRFASRKAFKAPTPITLIPSFRPVIPVRSTTSLPWPTEPLAPSSTPTLVSRSLHLPKEVEVGFSQFQFLYGRLLQSERYRVCGSSQHPVRRQPSTGRRKSDIQMVGSLDRLLLYLCFFCRGDIEAHPIFLIPSTKPNKPTNHNRDVTRKQVNQSMSKAITKH